MKICIKTTLRTKINPNLSKLFTTMAILAFLLFVIPINLFGQSTGEKVIFEKSISTQHFGEMVVKAINTEGNNEYFDKIEISGERNGQQFCFPVKYIEKSNIFIAGQDGRRDRTEDEAYIHINLITQASQGEFPIFDKLVIDEVVELINSKDNNSPAVIKNNDLTYYIARLGGLGKEKPDTSWLQRAKELNQSFGDKDTYNIIEEKFTSSNGNYTIKTYTKKGSMYPVRSITIQKDGQAEFEVINLVPVKFRISGSEPDAFAQIDLKGVGGHPNTSGSILDVELLIHLNNMIKNSDIPFGGTAFPLQDWYFIRNADNSLRMIRD